MKITMETENNVNPKVEVGDFLVTKVGRNIMIVEDESDSSFRVLDLGTNSIPSRKYNSIKEVLDNFSENYIVYKAPNIELLVKGHGSKWQ